MDRIFQKQTCQHKWEWKTKYHRRCESCGLNQQLADIPAKCDTLQNFRLIQKMVDSQGWILRNVIQWVKPNHMPSSVKDRFSNGYEPIFMLTKNNKPQYYYNERTGLMADNKPRELIEGRDWEWREVGIGYSDCYTKIDEDICESFGSPRARTYRKTEKKKYSFWHSIDYWFDLDAVREPQTQSSFERAKYKHSTSGGKGIGNGKYFGFSQEARTFNNPDYPMELNPSGKNPGDVWVMNTQPFPMAHFATFPEELVERCIKCACPREICTRCGKARVRITKSNYLNDTTLSGRPAIGNDVKGRKEAGAMNFSSGERTRLFIETIGWTDCSCEDKEWRPGIVLDPFIGSGTTMKVARRMGMSCIGIDINPTYIEMTKERVRWDEGLDIEFKYQKIGTNNLI